MHKPMENGSVPTKHPIVKLEKLEPKIRTHGYEDES
jgi:hypothetical protein